MNKGYFTDVTKGDEMDKVTPLVRRMVQKGANVGNSFWGCSRYPQCRGIRAVEMVG
jgi:ssDNA-binding Zn-finger/Zn-ribbon topoisomerase 1